MNTALRPCTPRRWWLGLVLVLGTTMACGWASPGDPAAAAATVPLEVCELVARTGDGPGEVELSFSVPGLTAPAEAFDVRAQVTHVDVAQALGAPVATTSYAVAAPGSLQRVDVTGLEPGRTLQFTVRARAGGLWGPFCPGVAARVKTGSPAGPPAGAIGLSAPATLSQDGATYVLTTDVTAPGTAFKITGRGITLDLAGHTVTYGASSDAAYGVFAEWVGGFGATVVRGGAIRQSGAHARCHGVRIRGAHDVRLTDLDVTVQGPDANAIQVDDSLSGGLRVDHCTLRCNTTVVTNRHYPGVAALWVEGAGGAVEIDANLILASPQWGILVAAETTVGPFLVHHNRVIGTHTRVVNGYMLGVHKPDGDIFENDLFGESRGIHVDGIDAHGHGAWIHDNRVRAQDQPNAEYPVHWCHGIKLEAASRVRVERNRVLVTADAAHSEAIALDITLATSTGCVVRDNVFEALSTAADKPSEALGWTDGAPAAGADLTVTGNVFRATDRFVRRQWDSDYGVPFVRNAWERDFSKGAGASFVFEQFDTSDAEGSPGHAFVDPVTETSTLVTGERGGPAPYLSERRATVSFEVRDAESRLVAGAAATIRNPAGALLWSGTTDATGRAAGTIATHRVRNGPSVEALGPFTFQVARSGVGTWSQTQALSAAEAWQVVLGTSSSGTVDTTAPAAPASVAALALSASRARVQWAPSVSPDVAFYLVRVDGVLMALSTQPSCVLAGLEPSASHRFTVSAVDAGRNVSTETASELLEQPQEDRGP